MYGLWLRSGEGVNQHDGPGSAPLSSVRAAAMANLPQVPYPRVLAPSWTGLPLIQTNIMSIFRLTLLLSTSLLASPTVSAQWTTATLSEARAWMGTTSVGGVAIFAGGDLSGGINFVPTATVDLYDAGTGVWSQATLSSARTSTAGTSVNGLALFAGGSLAGDIPSDAVDIYDAATGTWSVAQLSAARTGIGATTVGRYAVFAGGMQQFTGTSPSDVIDVFDAVTGTWSTATLPRPTRFAQAASTGDRAVILSDDGMSPLVMFDPSTGTSREITRPAQLSNQIIVTLATTPGRIWLVGGGQPNFPFSDQAHIYDLDLGVWSTEPLSEQRLAIGVASTSTKLIAAGGLIGVFQLIGTATVDVFDLLSGTSTSTQLSTPRYIPSAVEVEGRILIAGGFSNSSGSVIVSAVVDIFDDTLGNAYCAPAIPNSTGAPASLRLEGAPGTLASGQVSLVAAQLPEASAGYFLASLTQDSVPGAGGSQGTLCLGGSVGRYAMSPFFTAFDGTSTQLVDLTSLPNPAGSVSALAGETWSFQAWYRDANPTATTNFTPGVSLLIQ